jgi:hypothetical protein
MKSTEDRLLGLDEIRRLSNVEFALKLLEWHGGQSSSLYSIGSFLLSDRFHQPELSTLDVAMSDLRSVAEHPVYNNAETEEARTLAYDLDRRFRLRYFLSPFTRGYLDAAFELTTIDEAGNVSLADRGYAASDIAGESMTKVLADCVRFQQQNGTLLNQAGAPHQNGNDFYLASCRHGCDFDDRGYPEEVAKALNAAARAFGQVWFHLGDDGRIYV